MAMHARRFTTSCRAHRTSDSSDGPDPETRVPRRASMRAGAALLCAALLSSCAHTKPAGQALVAIGALTLGFGALDAAGVLGSDCRTSAPIGGEAVSSCGGDGIVSQEVDVLSIGIGAGLVAAGVVLWTRDSASTPSTASARGGSDRGLADSALRGALLPVGSPAHVPKLHRCSIQR